MKNEVVKFKIPLKLLDLTENCSKGAKGYDEAHERTALNSNYGLQVNAVTVKHLDSDGPEVMYGGIPK